VLSVECTAISNAQKYQKHLIVIAYQAFFFYEWHSFCDDRAVRLQGCAAMVADAAQAAAERVPLCLHLYPVICSLLEDVSLFQGCLPSLQLAASL
jgi:hypothetical protein